MLADGAPAHGELRRRGVRDARELRAIRPDPVDVVVAFVVAGEGDPLAVRRPRWVTAPAAPYRACAIDALTASIRAKSRMPPAIGVNP